MLDFQRKKDSSILCSMTQRDNSFLNFDQSKNLYDFIIKHENQMKQMESEIINLKSQIMEITTKIPLLPQKNIFENDDNNNEIILNIKEDIKSDIMKEFNNAIFIQKNEFKNQIETLKDEIEIINENKNNNNKILEINNSLENLTQQLMIKNEEKDNLNNSILNQIESDKNEINLIISNINKRIDNFDLDFDRLIQSLKAQFLNSANSINNLEMSKVNVNEYEKQIEIINQNMEEVNNKLENVFQQIKDNINNNKNIKNSFTIDNAENDNEEELDKKLNMFKDEIYSDLEKINLKILNELKNQADDIKILYQDLNSINDRMKKRESKKDIKLDFIDSSTIYKSKKSSIDNITSNVMSMIESELLKKANLDQLNFALETQAKLNEAFSSATRISRFCWDSEGVLNENKYIKWSIQNINTALDVFKWENNSDNINILQNGVYKIVIGLIGLETKKNFGLIINNDDNTIINNNDYFESDNDNDINNDKGNIIFMEKYIACVENTKVKVILFDSNDNSEEAFLEITKII